MIIEAKNFSLPIDKIVEKCPEINNWVDEKNKIDLGNYQALYFYNKCLFKILDNIELDLDIHNKPEVNLIPTAGLRRAIVDIIFSTIHPTKIIEIGTGATAIMALLFAKKNVKVIATEINEKSFQSAVKQIKLNHLENNISIIKSSGGILNYLKDYFPVDCLLSLPPYYANNTRKLPKKVRGFQGIDSELYSFGEGTGFSSALLKEWYETNSSEYLCILWKNFESVEKVFLSFDENTVTNQTIEIKAGTRTRYLTITKKVKSN